jgi:hypothetical protein
LLKNLLIKIPYTAYNCSCCAVYLLYHSFIKVVKWYFAIFSSNPLFCANYGKLYKGSAQCRKGIYPL